MPGKDVTTMNRVILMGRLTKNPEIKYAGKDNDMAVARYTLAVNRRYKRDGEQEADFISCITFGKSAEFAQKYLHKGMRIVIGGRISTGSYKDKDGKTIYTTDVPIGFATKDIISSDAVQIVPNATLYHFGVLTSNVHMAWMRAVCGRLKSDYRYSKEIVYNTFPWPKPTEEQRIKQLKKQKEEMTANGTVSFFSKASF